MNFIFGPIDFYPSIIGSCSTNMHHTTGACVPARIGDVFDSSNRWRGGWCACKYFSWCGSNWCACRYFGGRLCSNWLSCRGRRLFPQGSALISPAVCCFFPLLTTNVVLQFTASPKSIILRAKTIRVLMIF